MADVPCGTCRLCCTLFFVFLDEDEYERFNWGWCIKDGQNLGRVLRRRSNGECVYLGESGCTVHDSLPRVCRDFDCRALFKSYDRAGRRRAIKNRVYAKELFDRGRELLEEAS